MGPVGSCAPSANTGTTRTTAGPGTIWVAEEGGMADESYQLYVGVDWATEAHQICVLSADGRRLKELSIPHSGAGLAALRAELQAQVSEPARIAVAIEVPQGPVVEALLDHGCHVYAINPKQLDRFRDRHTVAGAKDDRRDAFVGADALRTDRRAFRQLHAEEPALLQLRELSRLHGELVTEHGRLTNRLREQLWRYYPQLLALSPAADEPWLWALLAEAPTPAHGRRLTASALRALLARHRIRRLTGDAVHAALQAPALPVSAGTLAAAREHVELLLPRLQLVQEQQGRCERRLEAVLEQLTTPPAGAEPEEHRDVTILRSLPGVGRVVAATMLAEASRPLAARDYQTLRAQAGTAPVTRQSGKMRLVLMRRACNRRLRAAVFHWTRNSIRLDAHSRAHYQRLRIRHGHARALRGVADRLLDVLIAMLLSRTLYDPQRRHPIAA
jgi:transposase